MRKLLPLLVVVILVLSGLGAVALDSDLKEFEHETVNFEKLGNGSRDFTHDVFGEYGTATWCPFCKYAHGALKELYSEGTLDFYYVSLVDDMNTLAAARIDGYNIDGFPTVWWDGGYDVDVGAGSIPGAKATYTTSINSCGARAVKNVNINLYATWLGGTNMQIDCTVYNNEATTYDGTIRVYITDISSSEGWTDTAGNIYTFAFLDWAFNEDISIPGGGSWSDSTTWDGSSHGYSSVTEDNTMIYAAVFNNEWHQGYSDPPSGNPFDAYYVDDSAEYRVGSNRDPNTPSNPDPDDSETDVELDPTLSWDGGDPDWFDSVYYDVYFEAGDTTPDVLVSNDQTETTYDPGTLDLDTTYYWQIVSRDNHNAVTDGPIWSFTTRGNDPPNTPSNPDPSDGETGVRIHADLSWDGGDPDGDAVTYDVYFGTSSPPPLVSSGQTEETYNPGTLALETKYYWRVIAEDSFGLMATGPIWDFTTRGNDPPYEPSNPDPADGATGVVKNPVLDWTGGDPDGDATYYDVYFDQDPNPTTLVSENQLITEYEPGELEYETTYYWKIVAEDTFGEVTEGPIWHFTTKEEFNEPPNAPTIDGETGGDVGKSYQYTFNSTDPDGDDIAEYIVNWGDGPDEAITGPFASGSPATASHTWTSGGDFTITARAKDVNGLTGPTGTLEVTMPRNRAVNTPFLQFLQNFLQQYPILYQLLQRFLRL